MGSTRPAVIITGRDDSRYACVRCRRGPWPIYSNRWTGRSSCRLSRRRWTEGSLRGCKKLTSRFEVNPLIDARYEGIQCRGVPPSCCLRGGHATDHRPCMSMSRLPTRHAASRPGAASPDERIVVTSGRTATVRWYAALEAIRLGHGGERLRAQITGLDPQTIRRGRRELASELRERPAGGVRTPGAGRPSAEKKTP